jgi:TolB-like protein
MSGDPEQEYFADGISEDIITALSKISGLFVIARNSSFTFKGKAVHVGEVSKKLGVWFVSARRAIGYASLRSWWTGSPEDTYGLSALIGS